MRELRKELKEVGVNIPLGMQHAADLYALEWQPGLEITTERQKDPSWLARQSKRHSPNIVGAHVDF